MKTTPLVSVLIPIYNVEPYLSQCLDSVVQQTLRDIEIICINDGSMDQSLAIIEKYRKQDKRIILIDKPNSGYGDSMNQGLKKASGEYIGIVEPDDWIEPDAFEKMYQLGEKEHADIVRANYFHFSAEKDEKQYVINPDDIGYVVCPRRQTSILYQAPAIWSAIYRRAFLLDNHIEFLPTPGASFQDTGFNFKALASANRVVFTDEAFLHYRVDNSSSSVKDLNKIYNVCEEYASIEEYLREHQLYDKLAPLLQATKFGAYYWNMMRLDPKVVASFIDRVRQEYASVELYREYFLDPVQWELLDTIIHKDNRAAIHALKRAKLKLNTKKSLRNLYLKTHPKHNQGERINRPLDVIKKTYFKFRPSYRKQQEIKQLVDDLNDEIKELKSKLQERELHDQEN